MPGEKLDIRILPAIRDNYIYLLHEPQANVTVVVDPGEAVPVLAALEETGWQLDQILLTHRHWDHVDGVPELKEKTSAPVIGPAEAIDRLPPLDRVIEEGDTIDVGLATFEVIATPGHTSGHVVLYCEAAKVLFSGDTLFHLGCGRIFEGTPEDMWGSLKKIKDLPDETLVYCGHEYSEAGAEFSLSVDPENALLQKRVQEIRDLRAQGLPTIPFNLGLEKQISPYLRADDPELPLPETLRGTSPRRIFKYVRELKDQF